MVVRHLAAGCNSSSALETPFIFTRHLTLGVLTFFQLLAVLERTGANPC